MPPSPTSQSQNPYYKYILIYIYKNCKLKFWKRQFPPRQKTGWTKLAKNWVFFFGKYKSHLAKLRLAPHYYKESFPKGRQKLKNWHPCNKNPRNKNPRNKNPCNKNPCNNKNANTKACNSRKCDSTDPKLWPTHPLTHQLLGDAIASKKEGDCSSTPKIIWVGFS